MRNAVLLLLCAVLFFPGRGTAQRDSSSARETNIELLQKAIRESLEQIVADGKIGSGERIAVKSPRDENSWLIDQAAFGVLADHSVSVVSATGSDSSAADARLELVPLTLCVRYSAVFHDGLFGEARTERSVDGKLSATLVGRDGAVRLSKVYSRTLADTIPVDAIASVEHPTLKIARGDPPSQGIFDAMLAPVVIIGSIAIAVYLLFTVRS